MSFNRYNYLLAIGFASQATFIAILVFCLSRSDHDMKLLALGAAISQTSALMSTASTMLVGKDVTGKHDPSDFPPGSVVSNKETVSTPPIVPGASDAVKE